MKKQKILKIGSFVLLFTFLLNSVPKVFLHEVFAKHCHKNDKVDHSKATKEAKLKQVSNCGHEKLFTEVLHDGMVSNAFFSNTYFVTTSNDLIVTIFTAPVSSKDYCGPPAVV